MDEKNENLLAWTQLPRALNRAAGGSFGAWRWYMSADMDAVRITSKHAILRGVPAEAPCVPVRSTVWLELVGGGLLRVTFITHAENGQGSVFWLSHSTAYEVETPERLLDVWRAHLDEARERAAERFTAAERARYTRIRLARMNEGNNTPAPRHRPCLDRDETPLWTPYLHNQIGDGLERVALELELEQPEKMLDAPADLAGAQVGIAYVELERRGIKAPPFGSSVREYAARTLDQLRAALAG